MTEAFPRGRVVWHELLTNDIAAATAFYKATIGWGTKSFSGGTPYQMWTASGVEVGGVMLLPEDARRMGAPPNWLMYVAVPDVDATVREAAGLGSKIYVPAQDIPGVGRFAVLGDPQGAMFAVYRAAGFDRGHDEEARPGEFCWHELATLDGRAAWDFYHSLFGWQKTSAWDMGAEGVYQMFGRGGVPMGGMYSKPAEIQEPRWLCYVQVADVDAAAANVQLRGGKITSGPMDVPGGARIANCLDPQGAPFALHALPKAAAAPRPAAKPAVRGAVTPKKATAKPSKPSKTAKAKPRKATKAKPKARKHSAPKSKGRKPKAARKAAKHASGARKRAAKSAKRRGRRR
jgi:predicted enzyme related to lactoylglutathione lyase